MNKRDRSILIMLGTPLLAGLVLGYIIGLCCGLHRGRTGSEKIKVGEPVEQVETPDGGSGDADLADRTEDENTSGEGVPAQKEVIYYTSHISYQTEFADLNEETVEYAKKVGLAKIPKDRKEVRRDKLVKIEDNDCYIVDELNYSVPYLTKKAAAELDAIASAFRDSLRNKELPEYKLIVTSVLRTEEDVEKLHRSGNPNASDNSAHCYGTTFDITYIKYFREKETDEFMQPFELTKVLAEVLRDRRNAGRIFAKYERQEHCFHITAK